MSVISSFMDGTSTAITKQALKTINQFRKGHADLSQLQTAFKALAGAGNLYKNPDTGYDNRCKDYYWLNNDHLENIDGDYREIERASEKKSVKNQLTVIK